MTCDEVGRQEEGAQSRSVTGIPYIAAILAANPQNREEPVNPRSLLAAYGAILALIGDGAVVRITKVVLATAHLDHHPTNNRPKNLKALCQRCHIIHDRDEHRRRRWLTLRMRKAIGDLFLGLYRS
ncbi:MAG: hypothetical protein ACLPOA_06465 [Methylocella sp.]